MRSAAGLAQGQADRSDGAVVAAAASASSSSGKNVFARLPRTTTVPAMSLLCPSSLPHARTHAARRPTELHFVENRARGCRTMRTKYYDNIIRKYIIVFALCEIRVSSVSIHISGDSNLDIGAWCLYYKKILYRTIRSSLGKIKHRRKDYYFHSTSNKLYERPRASLSGIGSLHFAAESACPNSANEGARRASPSQKRLFPPHDA